MGLAASQARFLSITARKADCEYRSMEIAQNKLSVTREMQRVTQNYQNSLNATKLIWDYDGSGEDLYDLSYGIMMKPGALNNYTPYLVTSRTGKVVLNNSYAKAVESLGDENLLRKASNFQDFMNALAESGVISQAAADEIIFATTNTFYTDADGNQIFITNENKEGNTLLYSIGGVSYYGTTDPATSGGVPNQLLTKANLEANGVDIDKILNKYQEVKMGYNPNVGYGEDLMSKNEVNAKNIIGLMFQLKDALLGIDKENISTTSTDANAYKVKVNSSFKDGEAVEKLTVADLLKSDVVYMFTLEDNNYGDGGKYNEGEEYNQINGENKYISKVNTILDKMYNAFKEVLGVDQSSNKALELAFLSLKRKIGISDGEISESKFKDIRGNETDGSGGTDTNVNNAVTNATDYIAFGYGDSKGKKNNDTIAINLSNMASAFLTYFENALNGFENGYSVADSVAGSELVTDNEFYTYVMNDTNTIKNETLLKADFYMQLYNNICTNGYEKNQEITDSAYLENTLKNGTYFISTIGPDGYFYQGRYTENDCVVEVKDDDAIAIAELDYELQKSKLEYKEEKLDLEMKNLDTEISSLSSEYESVKNLISKNVEKIFSQFNS